MYNQKNITRKNSYFNVCKNLVLSDLIIFKKLFVSKFINFSIWIILLLVNVTYILPSFGLAQSFAVFQFAAMLAAIGIFEVYSSIIEFVADLQGDRIIDYNLILPIPSWLAIASKAFYYFIVCFVLSIMMIPLGKILLWNQLDLSVIHYDKLLLAMIFQNMFYACFVIWASTLIVSMSELGNVWQRCIFPMWFMGGFQFSWISLYKINCIAAYIDLINPMIYITEAMRVAILGQADYLNFWMCLGMIALFSVIAFTAGLWNLKTRLDFVW